MAELAPVTVSGIINALLAQVVQLAIPGDGATYQQDKQLALQVQHVFLGEAQSLCAYPAAHDQRLKARANSDKRTTVFIEMNIKLEINYCYQKVVLFKSDQGHMKNHLKTFLCKTYNNIYPYKSQIFQLKTNKKYLMSARMYGHEVYRIGNGSISSIYGVEIIKRIEIRASRLLHGAFSWIVTLMANLLTAGTNDPIEHWWLIIQTDSACYTLQRWINGPITMQRNTSQWKANQVGLYCAGKQEKSDHWSKKSWLNGESHKTLSWLVKQLQSWNFGKYSFCNANCQDFSEWVYGFIVNPEISQKSRYPCTALFGVFPLTGAKQLIYK